MTTARTHFHPSIAPARTDRGLLPAWIAVALIAAVFVVQIIRAVTG